MQPRRFFPAGREGASSRPEVPRGGFAKLQAVEIVLTAGCNLRCSYCYQNRKKGGSVSWPVARAAVDLLFRSRRRDLALALVGGEPLLEFGLFRRVVEYAAAARPSPKRLRFGTTTNGVLLDEAKAAFLAGNDVGTTISFDGVPAAQELRGPGTFPLLDRLLDRLRHAHAGFYRRRVSVSITVVGAGVAHLDESVRYFLGKGVKRIVAVPCVSHDPHWRTKDIDLLDRELDRVFRTCLRHYERTGEVPFQGFRHGDERRRRRPRRRPVCSVGKGRDLAVDVDGQVYGCVMFAKSYQTLPPGLLPGRLESMRLGDVRDPALGRRLGRYRRAVEAAAIFGDKQAKHSSYGRCGSCRYFDSCDICPMSIGYAPGNTDPTRIPDLPCAWNLVLGKYRERFPAPVRPIDLITGRATLPGRIQALLALGAARRSRPAGGKDEVSSRPPHA